MRHSSIKAKGSTAEILIYEDIGEGFFGGLGAKAFREQITALQGVDTLNIRINSDGGSVFEGAAIYNTLKDAPMRKNVIIDGIAASIASLIAMAGDSITIQPTAMMMIHGPRGDAYGPAATLRATADLLDAVGEQMGVAYARSGKSSEQILEILKGENYYTAQQAVAEGWADALVERPLRMAASIKDFKLAGLTNVPNWVKARREVTAANPDCTCDCLECVGGSCADCTTDDCDFPGCTCPQHQPEATAHAEAAVFAARMRNQNLQLAARI